MVKINVEGLIDLAIECNNCYLDKKANPDGQLISSPPGAINSALEKHMVENVGVEDANEFYNRAHVSCSGCTRNHPLIKEAVQIYFSKLAKKNK